MDERDEYGDGSPGDDERDKPRTTPRPAGEGVRIIGAEEAAAAIETGQVASRRPDDEPRFGDVPPAPEGPRPGVRFPLPESVDPADVASEVPPVAPIAPPPVAPTLPHWSEPPTGEVPQILASEEGSEDEDDFRAWSSFSGGPRWRDTASDWDDEGFAPGDLAGDDDDFRLGALATQRTEHSDLYSFDEPEALDEVESQPEPARVRAAAPGPQAAPPPAPAGGARRVSTRPQAPPPLYDDAATPPGGRDLGTALATGLGFGIVALLMFKAGPAWAMLLATTVVTLAAVELFNVLRKAGYRPATMLGLAGTVSLMVAAYNQGETAVPMVLALVTVFSFLWYLARVEPARPTINVVASLGGFMWVGFLGSFAALLLRYPNRHGIAFLLGAIIATVANDAGAYFVGRQMGSSPMAPTISPNKTWEGFFGGLVVTVIVSVAVTGSIAPWGRMDAFWLALVISVVAPIGDLCESMIKRDIGIKDMGALLPGHGGILDRFDALLFALPATYYLVRLLNIG